MTYKSKPCSYIVTDTPCGSVKGLRKDGYRLYHGIRFATAERFEDPQLVEHWEGEYDATRPGPWCYQYGTFDKGPYTSYAKFYTDEPAEKKIVDYSEDCLNLNIWVPEGATNAPVAVFVHGGSYVSGGNAATSISGVEYCKRGVILVSINYRLNAFANAYDGKKHLGNYALKDQMAAFQWIKKNIGAFGGNPDQVVAIGESAGALSLQCLLYAPKAKGLFEGAIMMSGGGYLDAMNMPPSAEYTKRTWDIVLKNYGVSSIDELKSLPAKEIYDAWTQASLTDMELVGHCAKPIVDGDLIPKPIPELIASGELNDVPCIFGMSSEDMWPYILYTRAVDWALMQDKAGRSPVYAYYMDRQLPGDDAGAFHACDLWYAFGTLDLNWRPFTPIDYRLSENMIDYFAAFVKNCTPNDGTQAEWTPITQDNVRFIRFGDEEPAMYEPPVEKIKAAIQNTLKPFPGM